ncbi:DNA-3-methyladenine glycosylase I, partial [Escherichia coli]|nr:DNA-3-methyladenine glycosylase I [Escherichia coli]
AYLNLLNKGTTLDKYLWQFTEGEPIINNWNSIKEIPVTSEIAISMSKDMKLKGFSFVGDTICYALMQAVGMVNDHIISCYKRTNK